MSHEQAVHDRINLYRLVRRLEKSIAEEGWHNPGDLKNSEPFPHAVWIRTQGTLGVSPNLSLSFPAALLLTRVSDFVTVSFSVEDKTCQIVAEECGAREPVTVRLNLPTLQENTV